MKDHEKTGPSGAMEPTQDFGAPESGGHRAGTVSGAGNSRTAPEDEALSPGSSACSSEATPERTGPCANAEGTGRHQVGAPPQYGMSYRCLLRQNHVLLTALEELQSRCATLKKENSLMRKSCFPETQEKVRHLKRKNAELAVIAKRLEERARKLHEANLKVVNAPVAMKGSCAGLCKKTLARQRAADLRDQASALLAKDKQINALQQECQELQAKTVAGKEVSSHPPPLLDFHHLLRESQKEVLRLQRQIALKSIKAPMSNPRGQGLGSGPAGASRTPTCPKGFSSARVSRGRRGTYPATEATNKTGPRVLPLAQARDGNGNSLPLKRGIATPTPEIKQQIQQLESELRKKRKQCENLEHEVRKRHKRYAELEIQFQEVRSDNARLSEENALLLGQVEWIEKVESQNADLRLQVAVVSEERDSALQKTRELESRLESLRQALKHMRDVAERRQHLEHEHETALQALQKKQEEVRHLQQAQAEARKAHEGAVQLLEESLDCMQARVQELEDQCQSHTEQFQFLSRELTRFPLQAAKAGLPPSPPQVTPEVAFAARCPSPPQLLEDRKEKDPGLLPMTPWCNPKVQDEGAAPRPPGLVVPAVARSPEGHVSPVSSKRALKKPESQSSSSRSESIPTASPKSCPTPEVDTASEMEDLDIDSVSLVPETENPSPVKLRVFLARYSYNPFDGPNENPEAELPLTAGEYIYVYGDMDEDGFLEGELMDGRRGLVPSNFVERVSDDDLVTVFPGDLRDLSHSSPLEHGFLSTSLSSGERSDYSAEELSLSTTASRLEGDPGGPSAVVPYPRKVVLLKQFGSSLLLGWEPPLLPAGSPEIQSYNVLVDAETRQNVKAGGQTKAVIEKLDLNGRAYRISVQSVAEKGLSDSLQCTFLVGKDFAVAPSRLAARSVTATSAEISWAPSNSNFPHAVFLDGEERGVAKAGVYWFAFHDLKPGTSYVARVEAQPQGGFWESVREQPLGAEVRFTTTPAGSPDAPLDVRVEPGPTSGILVISWLPVTIDAEGSSNGVRVTGYAVYADGQKLMEVTSPTAGSVLVEVSQLRVLQACREVSVRTVSLCGESLDSVPAQIPLTLLESTVASSLSEHLSPGSRFSRGEGRSSPTLATSLVGGSDRSPATGLPVNRFAGQGRTGGKKGEDILRPEMSPERSASPSIPVKSDPPSKEEMDLCGPSAGNPATLMEVAHEGPRGNSQEGTENPGLSARAPELCPNHPMEQDPEVPSPERRADNVRSLQGAKTPLPGRISTPGEDEAGEGGQNERPDLDGVNGSSGRAKEPPGLALPRARREGEKRSDPGSRPLNLLSDHSRGSDLSDIMEEDEEEEDGEKRSNHPADCPGRENGEKQDPGDPDSDDEILERLLEMQPANPGRKALFSIPEVAEEEEEEEESETLPVNPVLTSPGVKPGVPYFDGRPETMDVLPPLSPRTLQPKSPQNRPERIWPERGPLPQARDGKPPACPRRWEWGCLGKPAKADVKRRRPRHCKERSQWAKMQSSDRNLERSSSVLGPARPAGGGLYRAQSLTENLDVISSLGTEEISTLCGWQRPRPRREMVGEPLRALSRCLSPDSLEIDVEYDSEEDLTLTSTAASQDSSEGQAEGSPTDPEEGWSDSSGCSGSVRSGGAKELKRCSSWEEESLEWSGSPVRSPSWKQRVALDERSRSLERSPSLCRARPERPWKESPRGPSLPLWAATGHGPPESLSLATRRAPTRRGRRLRRKIREAAASGAWRSPSPETTADEGDSARLFVALFDYDPVSMSPNPDAAEEELPFQEGQILKVYGPKDADGFYQGEGGGRIGYIPCNMVSEIQVDEDMIRPQLLDEDHLPMDRLMDRLDNCAFSGPAQDAAARPPKPRRSKKVGQKKKDEEVPNFEVCDVRDPSSEEETPRTMVAIFDYNPKENSPNPDAEAELKFCAGDLVTVLGSMDDDGFYYAEIHGQKGLVPSNFLEAVASDAPVEPSRGRQPMRKKRVQ